jgi:crotonobetainyl-CoA:carnitine CoA-transferase CaiB-like acyl-CoA transferase
VDFYIYRDVIHAYQLKEKRANAALVVQNAHLNKLNQVLHTKENKKKSNRTMLFAEGFGCHLTNDESIALVKGQRERWEKEAEGLEQRRIERVDQKAARAVIEAEWKEIVQKHDEAVVEWKAECQRLRAEGVRAKDLPKKPKRHLKPKLPVEEPIDSEDEASSSSSGGSDD